MVFSIECRVVMKIQRHSPVSFSLFTHVYLWCLLFDPHRTTYQFNIGVQVRRGIPAYLSVSERLLIDGMKSIAPVSRMEVDASSGNSGTSIKILHFGTHVTVSFRPLWKV